MKIGGSLAGQFRNLRGTLLARGPLDLETTNVASRARNFVLYPLRTDNGYGFVDFLRNFRPGFLEYTLAMSGTVVNERVGAIGAVGLMIHNYSDK